MRTALLLLAILAVPASANQIVWKWVDEKGVTHYSDRPMPGATRMELNVVSTPTESGSAQSTTAAQDAEPPPAAYLELSITSPAEGETFVNTGGQVPVSVRIAPGLQSGHRLLLYLDNRIVEGLAENSTDHVLNEVPRGLHSLTAVIEDASGRRLLQSDAVRFFVRQESIAKPPVGPALRPQQRQPRTSGNKLPETQPSYAALNGQRAEIDPATNLPKPRPTEPKQP